MPSHTIPLGTPFCGFQPPASAATSHSVIPAAYGLKGSSRGKFKLTWSFSGTVTGVKTPTTDIVAAFNAWRGAAPSLSFSQVNSGADISIVVGNAGNAAPGIPAAAVTTSDGRTITISSALAWNASGANNDLLNVLTHEIGHALGLLHATTPASIMWAVSSTVETLQPDDIHAIQALYSWSPQRQLQGGTTQVPAICACGGTLMMAWKGTGSDVQIWVSTSTDGQNWTPQRAIPGANTIGGPALAWDGARVWMAWRGAGEDSLWWATSTDFFQRQTSGIQHLGDRGSSHGPRIAIINNTPSMVWKGVNNDSGIYFSTFVGGQWGGQRNLGGIATTGAPAICQDPLGGARLAWKGTGSDTSLWTTRVPPTGPPGQTKISWTVPGNANVGSTSGFPGSAEGPGLTFDPGSNRILIVWRGIPSDDGLWFTQLANDALQVGSAEEWSTQAPIPNTGALLGASIADFRGTLHAAWKGINNDTGIYTATL